MWHVVAILVLFSALFWAQTGYTDDSTTSGFCSPIIKDAGTVQIVCNGIPEEALAPLAAEIRAGRLALDEANDRAEKWAERYFELSDRLGANAVELDPGDVEQASNRLLEGDLAGADTLLSEAIRQRQVDRSTFKEEMVSVLSQLASDGLEPGGVLDKKFLWPTGKNIKACFFNGTKAQREFVARSASIWSLHGNFEFDFGSFSNGFNNCVKEELYDIRIDLENNRNFSYLGTSAERSGLDASKPTMGLSAQTMCCDDQRFQEVVLHEFGHALALYHVYAHPDNCSDQLDWEAIYSSNLFGGWTKERIRRLFFAAPEHTSTLLVGAYDRRSIMQYRLPDSFYLDTAEEGCKHSIEGLSILDKLAVFRAYPFE
jgi:hypothetical protein